MELREDEHAVRGYAVRINLSEKVMEESNRALIKDHWLETIRQLNVGEWVAQVENGTPIGSKDPPHYHLQAAVSLIDKKRKSQVLDTIAAIWENICKREGWDVCQAHPPPARLADRDYVQEFT